MFAENTHVKWNTRKRCYSWGEEEIIKILKYNFTYRVLCYTIWVTYFTLLYHVHFTLSLFKTVSFLKITFCKKRDSFKRWPYSSRKTAANQSHLQVCMFGAPSLSRDSVAFLVLWKGLDRRQEPSIFTTEPVRLAPLLKCLNENVAFPAFQRQAHHTYILRIRFSRQQSKCTRFHTWRKLK